MHEFCARFAKPLVVTEILCVYLQYASINMVPFRDIVSTPATRLKTPSHLVPKLSLRGQRTHTSRMHDIFGECMRAIQLGWNISCVGL